MAERVQGPGSRLAARLARVPSMLWLVLLLLGGVLVASLVAVFANSASVEPRLLALPRGSTDSAFKVTYEVSAPKGRAVECRIQAVDVHHDVVGELVDQVPARSDGRTSTREIVIDTSHRAVSADIQSCTRVSR